MCGLFSKKEKIEPKYLIALIGMTGAGKSTFISKATGRKDIEISNSSSSCTKDIQAVSFKYKGSQVTLIDTPGFDDTNRSDAKILQTIALFLSGSEQAGLPLTSIIFLQSVYGIRMQGSEKTRIRLIEKILGEDAFPNLILATTQWSHPKDPKEGDAPVEERRSQDDFWGYMIKHGARVFKHDNTKLSALKIVGSIIDNHKESVPLQMQKELAMNDFKVILTRAGKIADAALGESATEFEKRLQQLKRTTSGHAVDAADQDEVDDIQEKLNKTAAQKEKLRNARLS